MILGQVEMWDCGFINARIIKLDLYINGVDIKC
jgi:hypothetical protein